MHCHVKKCPGCGAEVVMGIMSLCWKCELWRAVCDPSWRWVREVPRAGGGDSYLGLDAGQSREHARLMGMQISAWPDGLRDFFRRYTTMHGPVSGDGVACVVAEWLQES